MRLLFIFIVVVFSFGAQAQDFGLLGGFHYTDAETTDSNFQSNGLLGYRLGAVVAMPVSERVLFRSGLIYSARHYQEKLSGTTIEWDARFSYLDVPALVQVNFNENFGVFAGMVFGINVQKDGDFRVAGTRADADPTGTTTLLPLVQVGVSTNFEDQFGLEAYYERGIGDIYDGAKNFSVYGANFIWWL